MAVAAVHAIFTAHVDPAIAASLAVVEDTLLIVVVSALFVLLVLGFLRRLRELRLSPLWIGVIMVLAVLLMIVATSLLTIVITLPLAGTFSFQTQIGPVAFQSHGPLAAFLAMFILLTYLLTPQLPRLLAYILEHSQPTEAPPDPITVEIWERLPPPNAQ